MATAHQKTQQKGYRHMALARRVFAARGAWMHSARNALVWRPNPAGPGLVPRSISHDLFGVWDLCVVEVQPCADASHGPTCAGTQWRYLVQVTDANNMHARRIKIRASGFPCTSNDLLMAYRGRGVFQVLRGPRFDTKDAEDVRVPPAVKTPKREKATA